MSYLCGEGNEVDIVQFGVAESGRATRVDTSRSG